MPSRHLRQLRELTRMRVRVQQDRNRLIDRIGRLLASVDIKLLAVASNIVGATGKAMLPALAAGVRSCETLANKAQGSLGSNIPEITAAFEGRRYAHFSWMLVAQAMIAETGSDMTHFPMQHIRRVGRGYARAMRKARKRYFGRIRKGDRYLRRILVQRAWAAGHTIWVLSAGVNQEDEIAKWRFSDVP